MKEFGEGGGINGGKWCGMRRGSRGYVGGDDRDRVRFEIKYVVGMRR